MAVQSVGLGCNEKDPLRKMRDGGGDIYTNNSKDNTKRREGGKEEGREGGEGEIYILDIIYYTFILMFYLPLGNCDKRILLISARLSIGKTRGKTT